MFVYLGEELCCNNYCIYQNNTQCRLYYNIINILHNLEDTSSIVSSELFVNQGEKLRLLKTRRGYSHGGVCMLRRCQRRPLIHA